MASLREVAEAARAAVAALPVQLLLAAEDALHEAATLWLAYTQGSADQAAEDVHALLHAAKDDLDNTRQAVEVAVPEAVQRWIAQLGIDATASAPQQPAPVATSPPTRMSPADQRQTLERLRGQLPPPVEAGSGAKTHGRWTAADGTIRPIVSGRDADSDHVDRLLLKRGLPARRRAARAADVELKLAARMVETGTRHVTVMINHRTCVGPYGCDTLVPIVLPAGYTMTVLGTDGYEETFEGGATPWWSR